MSEESSSETNSKVFIPLNIEEQNYGSFNYYLTGRRLAIPLIVTTVYVILLIFVLRPILAGDNTVLLIGMSILLLVYLAIIQKVIRIYTLEEPKMLKMYKQGYASEAPLTMSDLWNLYDFDEEKNIAKLYNLVVGTLVRVSRSSVIGKGEHFLAIDQTARADFYNQLLLNKLSILRMNRLEQEESTEELDEFGEGLDKLDNENLKMLMKSQNGYMKKQTRFRSLIEVDYYFIYTDDIRYYHNVERAIGIIRATLVESGSYTHVHALDKAEFIKFSASLNLVGYPDIENLGRNSVSAKLLRRNPVKLIGLFDENMELLKDLRELDEPKKGKLAKKAKSSMFSKTKGEVDEVGTNDSAEGSKVDWSVLHAKAYSGEQEDDDIDSILMGKVGKLHLEEKQSGVAVDDSLEIEV